MPEDPHAPQLLIVLQPNNSVKILGNCVGDRILAVGMLMDAIKKVQEYCDGERKATSKIEVPKILVPGMQ